MGGPIVIKVEIGRLREEYTKHNECMNVLKLFGKNKCFRIC